MGGVSDHSKNGQQTSAQVVEQSGREEGIVRAGETPVTHERPEDWGWHHEWGGTMRWSSLLGVAFLVAMLFGNHQGKVEDIWLILSAAVFVGLLVWDARRRKTAWRSN